MFEGDKYITRGIQAEVGIDLQLILWDMIEKLKNKEVEIDYLQVFRLTIRIEGDKVIQEIKHSQEVPQYEEKIEIEVEKPVDAKIFVISSNYNSKKEYSTMMLAEEY